ncbi:MAG: flagellar hook-basal body complex protein FliE [Variovorax paradoxus]|uniref:Flagellar hook-basal body complex protein FliE n=1 Tax=Variovorax paradoxus TaxID=34073 RepID=A0A2W5SJT4_VARPD|nr:MAG: flagellar hook-basal body complex protein FliE [Variovorax paradoxus]
MDLKLSPVSPAALARPAVAPRTVSAGTEAGFFTALSGALKSLSASQAEATQMQREVQMENPQVSLEQTMVSMQKAQIGFQAALHVRNRMVQAYTDIMNMQV